MDKNFKDLKKKYSKLLDLLESPTAKITYKVERVYKFIDEFQAQDESIKQAVCTKGCSHCCYVNVEVTRVEAELIAEKQNIKILSKDKPSRKDYGKNLVPCTFLDESKGLCSIYEYRPLACRTFFTMDSVDFCKDPTFPTHQVLTVQSNNSIMFLYGHLAGISGAKYADIREWF